MLEFIRKTAFELGREENNVVFDRSQIDEVAYWIMGRYHVKRIDLTGDLLFFNDRYYDTKSEALIRRSCRKIFTSSLNRDLTEVLKIIEDTCDLITWTDIENSVHIKVLKNGTYNIKTGEFSEKFSPDNIVLQEIPHDYIPNAWDDIDNVVSTIISDTNDRESFYDFLSLCLHPYNGINIQFGGVGPPGTGKSQLAELAYMVIGRFNTMNAAIHQLADDQTTQKEAGYKLLNIDADLSGESIQHLDVIKKWVTQDNFTARGIYSQPVDFRPTSRLLFFANELYEMTNPDDAEAIYERTHLIKIEKKFRGSQTEIKSIMKSTVTPEQLSGFMVYLLDNANQIWKAQKIRHPMPFNQVEDNWNLFGNRIKEFISKYCVVDAKERTESDTPYDLWLSYAMEKGYHNKDKKRFRKIFDELVGSSPAVSRVDGESMRVYHGFRMKNRREVEEEDKLTIDETKPKKKRSSFADD
jgi:phage/plasmid-associated DNA primase